MPGLFQQVDAFVHRCRDLLDVCLCIKHFCNKTGDTEHSYPPLIGTNAAAVNRSMEGIRGRFRVLLTSLRADAGGNPLHGEKWKTAYQKFKHDIRELEVLIQGIISNATKETSLIQHDLEILRVFAPFNGRDLVRRTLAKVTQKVYNMLRKQVCAEHV